MLGDSATNSLLAQLHYERELRKAQQQMHWYLQGPQPIPVTTIPRDDHAKTKVRPLPAYDMRPWWEKQYGQRTPAEVVHSMAPWTKEKAHDDLRKLASTMPGAPSASLRARPDECDCLMNDLRIGEHMDAYTSLARHMAAQRHHHERGWGTKVRTPCIESSGAAPSTRVRERPRWKSIADVSLEGDVW